MLKLKLPQRKQLCTFDPVSMEYNHIKWPSAIGYTIIAGLCVILGFGFSTADNIHIKSQVIDYEKVPVVLDCNLGFSEQAMYELLVHMNVRFPHIVIAQARIESGNYTSNIFKENNNMFGMKCAKLRATTNIGENRNHAMFDTWQDCVMDYAFYQTTYMRKCKTEKQYINTLIATYAESGHSYGESVMSESKDVFEQYNKDISEEESL